MADRTCWKCKQAFPETVAVCVRCGSDLQTGAPISMFTAEEPEAPVDDGPKGALELVAYWMPGMLRPGVIVGAIVLALTGAFLIYLCLTFFFMGAPITAVPVGAVGLILFAQAGTWMLSGSFMLMHEAMVDFQSRHWWLLFAMCASPFALIFLLLKVLTHAVS